MKSFQTISITFALAIIVTQASATPINGRVADAATGEAIIGASIIYNNKVGAVTDVEGRFHLDIVSYPSDINVSYIGYESLHVKISERDSVVSIRLHEDTHKLNEVVVVGYGTQKRTQLTGSVATISSEKIDLVPAPTLDAALGGIVTGVDITQNGQPGAGSTIRIRGGNSVNASNNPLYVIDGFIYQVDVSSQKTGIGNLESTLDPLSFINPSDIDRIEVLKDVSATAIYGSRGANGVIIISTKKGNRQETQVRYKATVSFSTPSKKLELLNATEWARMEKDYFGNRGGYTDEQIAQLGAGTDWQSEVLRTGVSQIHELSISGGSEKTRFLISANYTDQQGIVLNSDFQRYNLRANIDHQLSEKFQVSLSSAVGKTKQHALSTTQPVNYFSSPYSAGITNSLTYALFMPPVVPVYAADGGYNYDNPYENAYFKLNGKSANPVSDLENTTAETLTNYALLNASLRYYIAEGLTAKVAVGANQTDITQNYFAPSYTALGLNEGGVGSIGHKQNLVTQGELTLDYERQLGDNHYVNALVGYTIQSTQTNFNLSTTSRYTNEDLGYNNLGDGSHVYTPSSGQTKATLNSLIARVNYTLLDRYNATATFRADRSSRFSKDNRWGYFPSLGLSWNIDREPFFSPLTPQFSTLKLRASVGSVGNQEIGDYEYAASYTASSYGGQTAYSKSNLGNSNLKWETTVSWNAGLDAGFWNNRLNVVIDYYYKKTSDLLLYLPVNSSTGTTSQLMNAGNVVNRGIELSVDATLLQRRDLQWVVNGNITHNHNELVKMSSDVKSLYSGELRESILREGEPVGSFYGYEFLGIDEQNGKVLLGEQTILGSHQPDFFYGFSTALKWKRWDASLSFKGSHGAKNVNLLRRSLDTPLGSYNALSYVKDSWTPTNTHTDVPAISGSWATSYLDGRYVEDASYLKLQNVNIGYTLPLRRIAKSIHLSVSAQNLLTITSYKGYDPELETGIDQGAYPKSRTFSVSAEVNF
jgi:TonB-linked SusC/RagA family outer membrane protein